MSIKAHQERVVAGRKNFDVCRVGRHQC
jgi:hypothetical protein